jgi:hypothetical protein
MKTYPLNTNGMTTAFEIGNAGVSRRGIARLLRGIPDVTDVQLAGHFGSANDVRVSFKYRGFDYEVEEPYGDNSRYLIGPKEPSTTTLSIEEIEQAFRNHRSLSGVLGLTFLLAVVPMTLLARYGENHWGFDSVGLWYTVLCGTIFALGIAMAVVAVTAAVRVAK